VLTRDGRRWKASFNADPERIPFESLIATDAAREGVSLQTTEANLIHFGVAVEPRRLEQRNDRIDRKPATGRGSPLPLC
jgi:hypothetical protein